jgi:hypothetical protein
MAGYPYQMPFRYDGFGGQMTNFSRKDRARNNRYPGGGSHRPTRYNPPFVPPQPQVVEVLVETAPGVTMPPKIFTLTGLVYASAWAEQELSNLNSALATTAGASANAAIRIVFPKGQAAPWATGVVLDWLVSLRLPLPWNFHGHKHIVDSADYDATWSFDKLVELYEAIQILGVKPPTLQNQTKLRNEMTSRLIQARVPANLFASMWTKLNAYDAKFMTKTASEFVRQNWGQDDATWRSELTHMQTTDLDLVTKVLDIVDNVHSQEPAFERRRPLHEILRSGQLPDSTITGSPGAEHQMSEDAGVEEAARGVEELTLQTTGDEHEAFELIE